jgi:hypothetical protein
MAGVAPSQLQNLLRNPKGAPISPTSQFGNPASFTAAANTQGSDYDRIMAMYAGLANPQGAPTPTNFNPMQASLAAPSAALATDYGQSPERATATRTNNASPVNLSPSTGNPNQPSNLNFNPIAAERLSNAPNTTFNPAAAPAHATFDPLHPEITKYQQSADVTKSLSDLSNLVNTGGYSEADKENIRARDVSPIRSIYSSAQQNAERAKALGGGYSPNFNASQAQMAREQAAKVGDVTTAANAGIAQSVAANKLSAAPQYASASASANAAQQAADLANANIINQINETNSKSKLAADEFNSSAATDVNKFNTSGKTANDQFNAQNQNIINQINATNKMNADQFNSQGMERVGEFNTQTNQANIDRQLRVNEFNSQAQNAINEANAARSTQNNQFNASNRNAFNEANANRQMQTGEFNINNTNALAEANANRMTQANQFNATGQMNTDQFNTNMRFNANQANKDNAFKAAGGMTNLYGTTPALTNLFGNQVVDATKLDQNQQIINNNRRNSLFGNISRF